MTPKTTAASPKYSETPAVDMAGSARRVAEKLGPVLPLHTPDPDHPSGCSCGRRGCDSEGKHPRTLSGKDDATRDEEQIKRWWNMWPDANIGLRTGAGLVVIDVDPRNGGDASITELEERHGRLDTLTARTGGGGFHLYLRGDLPDRKGLLPGIDLKAGGGYVVAPPSLHVSGRRYTWKTDVRRIAPAPRWLRELAEAEGGGLGPAPALDTAIPEGMRDDTLTSLAGTLRRRGLVAAEILPCLEAVNRLRCRPRLDSADLERIAESMMRYPPAGTLGEPR